MRAYTAMEIGNMRRAIREYGWSPNFGSRRSLERAMEVESRLVTYISAGVDPVELETTLRHEFDAEFRRQKEVVGKEFIDGREWTRHADGSRSWSNLPPKAAPKKGETT